MGLKTHFHFITFFVIVNILLIISQTPMIIRFLNTPQDRIFPFVHTDWAHDYYLYLAAINQGINGDFLYHDPYTTEPTTKGIFYIFFTTTGQIARIFHLNPVAAYHLLTIISFEMFATLAFLLSQMILGRKYAFWGALFGIIGTISPTLIWNFKIDFPINMPWWIMMDAFERLYALPHYGAAQALLLLFVILIINFYRNRRIKNAILAASAIFIAGIILPSVLLPIGIALPISYFFYILRNSFMQKKIILEQKIAFGFILIVAFAFICYILLFYQGQAGFPWNHWIPWGITRWNLNEPAFNRILLLSFGILPILALPAMVRAIRRNNWELIFISLWAILPFFMLPFVNILSIAKIRLTQEAPFIPFGILAAYTIFQIVPKYKYPIIAVFLLSTLPVSLNLLSQRIQYIKTEPIYDHFYIPKTSFEVIEFIKKNLPKNSVILTNEKMGNIIPAFAPTVSYMGHLNQTMNYPEKEKNVNNFFSGKWTDEEAKKFLIENGIRYVYYGWQEKELGLDISKYPFLRSIYKNEAVELFQLLSTCQVEQI